MSSSFSSDTAPDKAPTAHQQKLDEMIAINEGLERLRINLNILSTAFFFFAAGAAVTWALILTAAPPSSRYDYIVFMAIPFTFFAGLFYGARSIYQTQHVEAVVRKATFLARNPDMPE